MRLFDVTYLLHDRWVRVKAHGVSNVVSIWVDGEPLGDYEVGIRLSARDAAVKLLSKVTTDWNGACIVEVADQLQLVGGA